MKEMVDAAERVGDTVLAAVADEEHPAVAERATAVRAATEALIGLAGLQDASWVPVRALDGPGDDVLQPAERRLALALGLGRAKALVDADVHTTPAAAHAAHPWPQA
jgi:hypothetical protein